LILARWRSQAILWVIDMIYEYICHKCGEAQEVCKSVTEIDEVEVCHRCNREMDRIISFTGHVTLGTFKPGFYHAFGKNLRSKHELKDEMSRHKGETGQELYEVGNDQSGFKKPESKLPDKREVVQALNAEMKKHG